MYSVRLSRMHITERKLWNEQQNLEINTDDTIVVNMLIRSQGEEEAGSKMGVTEKFCN